MSIFGQKNKGELPGIFVLYLVISVSILSLLVINFEANFIWLRIFAQKLRNQSVNYELSQAIRVSEMMERSASGQIDDLHGLAYDLAVINLEASQSRMFINDFLKKNQNIRELSVIGMDGMETGRFSREKAYNSSDLRDFAYLEHFEKAKSKPINISYVNYNEYSEPYVLISIPIMLSGEAEPKAVLIGQYYLRGMWEIALETRIGQTGRISVIDDKGMLVADPRPSRVLKKMNLLNLPPAKSILKGNVFKGSKYYNENRIEVVGVGAPISIAGMKWGVIVEQNASEVEEALNEVSWWLLLILGGNIVVVLILLVLMVSLRRANKELVRRYYISELEKERALTEQNKTISIISNFVDPVLVVDTNWRLILFNPAARKVFGITPRDLGRKLAIKDGIFSFDSFKNIIKKVEYTTKEKIKNSQGQPGEEEVVIKKNNPIKAKQSVFNASGIDIGENDLIYKVFSAEVRDQYQVPVGYMKIFYDLTREKIVDKLKSEFVSITAHQLRTPLSSIKWVIKMVLDGDAGPINKEQADLLSKGYKSNERVINLVNDLLNVTRIEEGKFGFNFSKEDPSKIIDEIVAGHKELIESANIKLSVNKKAGIPEIKMDKEKIGIALSQFIDNAIRYTPNSGKIEISLEPSGSQIIFTIKDNGVGIPQPEINRLFTKFFRGANVVKMETEGNGLGLYIAKNIIDAHKGTVEIKSEEGKGTVVIIKLPIK
jgi:signal transduction histidine kinase